jgi:hypothetical protein
MFDLLKPRLPQCVLVTVLGGLLAGGGVRADQDGPGGGTRVEEGCGDACQEALNIARRATAGYHDVSTALADGFLAEDICVALPGVGAMGYHYPYLARLADTALDVASPEVLLYAKSPDGALQLVGLEYFAPVLSNGAPWMGSATEPPPVVDNPPPVLFGQTFQGPMPGHNSQMPWHYDLHVWAWRHNPAGTFSVWNPKVHCE